MNQSGVPQGDFQASTPFASFGMLAADAPAEARLSFIRKTYTHLAAAIYALVALEFLIFTTMSAQLDAWMPQLMGMRWGMLLVFGAFVLVSTIADKWAQSNTSVGMQYAGLFTYVAAEALFLVPLLWFANQFSTDIGGASYSPIAVAGFATLMVFGALTATVFLTKHDFSYLGPALGIASMVALGVILLAAFGLFNWSVLLSSLMVVLACGYILYDTSKVLHHYRTDQHVAASLALFASVALLFWYILQIVISLSGRD